MQPSKIEYNAPGVSFQVVYFTPELTDIMGPDYYVRIMRFRGIVPGRKQASRTPCLFKLVYASAFSHFYYVTIDHLILLLQTLIIVSWSSVNRTNNYELRRFTSVTG